MIRRILSGVVLAGIASAVMAESIAPLFSNRGEWNSTTTYAGSIQMGQGDTAALGSFNGTKSWWRARHFVTGESQKPGTVSAGKPSWSLINSKSAESTGKPTPTWIGANGNLDSLMKANQVEAVVATWPNGAEGVISYVHTDFGNLNYETQVKPAVDLAKDFPGIRQAWAVNSSKMDSEEWKQAQAMVLAGHEIASQGMSGYSASDYTMRLNPRDTLSEYNMAIPEEIRGFVVAPLWGDTTAQKPVSGTISFENDLIKVECTPHYTLNAPTVALPGTTVFVGKEQVTVQKPKVTVKEGVKTVVLASGKTVYVKEILGSPIRGYISAIDPVWFEPAELDKYGEKGWSSKVAQVSVDKGAPGFGLELTAAKGWENDSAVAKYVLGDTRKMINDSVYNQIVGTAQYGSSAKECSFFAFTGSVGSEKSYELLQKNGYIGSVGGEEGVVPTPSDFYHPFRIASDKTMITKSDWGADKGGLAYADVNNSCNYLGLNEMVDSVIAQKGCMIRSLSAVIDMPVEKMTTSSTDYSQWPINSSAASGWPGAITKDELKKHYAYIQKMVYENKLAVCTPSELIRYRRTADAVKSISMELGHWGGEITVECSTVIPKEYQTEISVLIPSARFGNRRFFVGQDGDMSREIGRVFYNDKIYYVVPVNPFNGPVKVANYDLPISGTDSKIVTPKLNGISGASLSLSLPAGTYQAEIHSVQGKLLRSATVQSNGTTSELPVGLARGVYLFSVKQGMKTVIPSQKIQF